MSALEKRLEAALAGSELLARLRVLAEPFLARHGAAEVAEDFPDAALAGLARVLATSAEATRLLARRPVLLERLAAARQGALAARARALEAEAEAPQERDLEEFLDAMRLLRREETTFAACLDLGGLAPFAEVSTFLSALAETILRRSLARAQAGALAGPGVPRLSVIGMGKIGGREFTYHSDLDLIFLYQGGAEDVARISRVGQRLISYLATATRAGTAYAVDTRLRPSGHQGMLVTSFDAFERYQREEARTWEHLVLMRARAVAGEIALAQQVLERARAAVLAASPSPWEYVAWMRERVEAERAHEAGGKLAFKTGSGGLMDVDFLAAGGMLERGAECAFPAFPGNAAMLRSAVGGARVERLLEAYHFLRHVEARARWVAGRAVEEIDPAADVFPLVAELMEAGLSPPALVERVNDARREIREAFHAVVEKRSIAALAD